MALLLQRGPALAEFGATIRYLWETPSVTGQMIALDGGQHLAWQTPDVTGMVGMNSIRRKRQPRCTAGRGRRYRR